MCFSLSDLLHLFHLDLEGNQVHPCCCKWQDFILFYSQVAFHCVYIYHIFFTHSSINEHLGCSHNLAIINNASMKTYRYMSF